MSTTVQQWLDTPNNSTFNADIEDFNRKAQKDNAEHFEEYVPRKYETVLQENGRWLIRRAQQGLFGMMIFILIFPGCATRIIDRDRAAFLVHARKQRLQPEQLQEYHLRLQDIRNRLDQKEAYMRQARINAFPKQVEWNRMTADGRYLVEVGSPLDKRIIDNDHLQNLTDRRMDAVEFFIENPYEMRRRLAIGNEILARFDNWKFTHSIPENHFQMSTGTEYCEQVPAPKTYFPPAVPTIRPPKPMTKMSLNVPDEHTATAVELYKRLEKIDNSRVPVYNAVLR